MVVLSLVNPICNKCLSSPDENDCKKCSQGYVKKEVIIMDADDSDYIHGECFETTFDDEKNYYSSIIGTQYRWKGKVKITIEQLNE